jgi:hypothetical protein
MAAERLVWADIGQALKRLDRKAQLCRIENTIGSGMPDANCCVQGKDVWIETKGMLCWPKVPAERIIRFDHPILPSQAAWHKARHFAGGVSWVILGLRDPKEWLIWTGYTAATIIAPGATRARMIETAALHCVQPGFPAAAFLGLYLSRAPGYLP